MTIAGAMTTICTSLLLLGVGCGSDMDITLTDDNADVIDFEQQTLAAGVANCTDSSATGGGLYMVPLCVTSYSATTEAHDDTVENYPYECDGELDVYPQFARIPFDIDAAIEFRDDIERAIQEVAVDHEQGEEFVERYRGSGTSLLSMLDKAIDSGDLSAFAAACPRLPME